MGERMSITVADLALRSIITGQHFSTRPLGWVNYQEYLETDEWKNKAAEAKRKAGNRCQLCNISGYVIPLHAHHRTYERLGCELEGDITVLCAKCHQLFHDNKPQHKKLRKSTIYKILVENGITEKSRKPWKNYERGKVIIQHIIDGFNSELYDYYNKVNIEILEHTLDNLQGRERA